MHPPKSYLLYFQQLRPLSKCVAGDGRVVGHLLIDLIESKPTDQTYAVRTFSNRMAMLRECGFRIGAFLVALLSPEHASVTPPQSNVLGEPQDPAAVTEEQATVLSRTLAAAIPTLAAYCAAAVLNAVNLHFLAQNDVEIRLACPLARGPIGACRGPQSIDHLQKTQLGRHARRPCQWV